ncbi:hypothetical protein BDN72DRAFT_893294 [Pluteus cervinus]|uniref:Uncharacterized protein n=1 Tax=Pluteus cervinus TaxID=181527 RepID=A0ACD3B850_9AGAR|nr:hypothetical protein BDN72DRAFT_893294 [Pluteus cervinus]
MAHDTTNDVQPAPAAQEPSKDDERIVRAYAKLEKSVALQKAEFFWRDHAGWLETRGYRLRPRYQPGWKPSIPVFGEIPLRDENYVAMHRAAVVDATRVTDGKRVLLKRIYTSDHPFEVEITKLFSTEPLSRNPSNYCVQLLEVLNLPDEPDATLLVFPFLQHLTVLPFDTFGEIVDFIKQIFEGLQFMHHHHVAHRDIGIPNIMMDGDEMFPEGWNHFLGRLTPQGKPHRTFFTRTQKPSKYYLIDFGLSRRYDPSDPDPLERPILGGDRTVPEFQTGKESFNPFRTDIYYVGNLIRRYIMEGEGFEFTGYFGTGFLRPLVKDMVQDDPEKRPTIDEVLARFEKICKRLSTGKLRSRPIPRKGNVFKGLRNHIKHWKRRRDFVKQGVPAIPSRQSPSNT